MGTPANPLAENNPTPQSRVMVCEFCGSRLAPSGEFLSLGENAKKFREFDDVKLKLETRINELTAENSQLRNRITELEREKEPVIVAPKSGNTIFQ